jgi:outer membrane protein
MIQILTRSIGILFLVSFIAYPSIAQEEPKPLELTVEGAILMALENNSAFKIQLMNPELKMSQEEIERSAFDLGISDTISTSESKDSSGDSSDRSSNDLQITKPLTTGGDISLGLTTNRANSTTNGQYSSKIGLSISHDLLKGAGTDIVLANLNKARLTTKSSKYELQAYAETLVSQIENTYWDYALAEKQLKIYEDSLALAQQQLDETNVFIEVGKFAEIERIASEAEVASRKEALINAKSNIEKTRLKLLQLLNPPGVDLLNQKIIIKDEFAIPASDMGELNPHIDTALQRRPDLNQARLLLKRNELDVMVTHNGLLPNMQFFINLGWTGYADSFTDSISSIGGDGSDFQVGVRYSQTIGNRNSNERYKQTLISREQSLESFDNLIQLAKLDVAQAWIELNRASEQIIATAASRKLQEEKLRAETEKYKVGRSTSLAVAQVQRDLLSSQIGEIQALANYRKAQVDLLRLESTLLEHYGISFLDDLTNESDPPELAIPTAIKE